MANTLHVVSHTHWDREWYLTFQQFRMRLVDLIDHLLELLDRDAEFCSFHLDAQTIVLEDYLEIKPHNRARIERYVREGRIIIGPWYQLNDEFLTSGEATVRSLLVGTRTARQFGACAAVGYLPDQFGNLSQMPQIFRGFGIDNAVFGRGYQLVGDRKMEFIWGSPDGSRVTASLMAYWYNNAQHVPADPDEAGRYMNELRERMAARSAVTHLLLMNGVDHLEPQADLPANLAAARERLTQGERLTVGDRILHSTVEAYTRAVIDEVRERGIELEKHAGELREDRGGSCLAGTLSARMYLKQANHHAQITLEKVAEPLAAFAMQLGEPYPYEFLHYAWKLLMNNHPHDSICGCSIDQVHREMLPRFAQVEQIGEELAARALKSLAARAAVTAGQGEPGGQGGPGGPGETGLLVVNTLNWPRTDPVRAVLAFPLGEPARGDPQRDDSRQAAGIRIVDAAGNPVPCAVTGAVVKTRTVLSPVELPLDQWVQEVTVEFMARDVPACGYTVYRVLPAETMPQDEPWEVDEAADSGVRWQPVLEDGGDVGDEYLYRRPAHDRRVVQPVLGLPAGEERSAVRLTRVYTGGLELPVSATGDLADRAAERVTCPVTTRVTRWRGSPRVEFETTIDNRARDHRLRVVFRNQGQIFHPRPYSAAEGQFDVVRRPLANPLASEGAATFYPQQNWVALVGNYTDADGERTVTVINHGLPEYEIYQDQDTDGGATGGMTGIAVTLLRCVNYLSRRDDGPEIETPEAQCLGTHTFRYAFLESAGDWQTGEVWKQAHQFNVPLLAVQVDGGAGGDASGQTRRDLPDTASFLTVEPGGLVVTALKRAEDDPRLLIARFFNITDEPVTGGRVCARGTDAAWRANLNEELQQPLEIGEGGVVELWEVRPKEIVTLALRMAGDAW